MHPVRVISPAKVNLFLEIQGRRNDGYHELVSIFQEVTLADEIEIGPRGDGAVVVESSDPAAPSDKRNLAARAALLLREETGVQKGAAIRIRKEIPVGGGLGGGSSNAAAVLEALDRLWELDLGAERLGALAARLGSDVPFFLRGGTALCRGRGEVIEPLAGGVELDLVLALPEWGVSTAEAYRALSPDSFGRRSAEAMLSAGRSGDRAAWAGEMFNRFEEAVFAFEPREERLFRAMGKLGFDAVRMSGSGSALFGIVPEGGNPESWRARAEGLPGVRRAVAARTVARRRTEAGIGR